jgi:hypothetical protein
MPLIPPFRCIDCLAPLDRSGTGYRSEIRRSTAVSNTSLILQSVRPIYCTSVTDEQEGSMEMMLLDTMALSEREGEIHARISPCCQTVIERRLGIRVYNRLRQL